MKAVAVNGMALQYAAQDLMDRELVLEVDGDVAS